MVILNKIYHGDVRDILRSFPDDFFNCCMTSPPYWGKRSYGTNPVVWGGKSDCEHEWTVSDKPATKFGKVGRHTQGTSTGIVSDRANKLRYTDSNICIKCGAWLGELGLEPAIDMFVDNLFEVFEEVYRVLRPDGGFYLNIDDTYYSSGPELPKSCMSMIPERIAFKMITDGKWILRSKIIWRKPNQMPSSATNRYTKDYEYVYFFTKNKKYYFEQQLETYTKPLDRWGGDVFGVNEDSKYDVDGERLVPNYERRGKKIRPNPMGKNKRTVWDINTVPSKVKHYASYPEELTLTPILASCPEKICTQCDKPVLKKYKTKPEFHIIYEQCTCNKTYRPGIVLDPFAGSGTTLKVAMDNNRDFVGIELKKDFIDIASERLGFDLYIKE